MDTEVSSIQREESSQDDSTSSKTPPLKTSPRCRTPYLSTHGKTPWGGSPRRTAGTPYLMHRLPVKSPMVAEVLREADTARFGARYHLKVIELRKANETIKRLKAEAAPAQALQEMLTQRDAELLVLTKELEEAKKRTEEIQKEHVALKEKLSSLTSQHAAALQMAVEKERVRLKQQQAASNQRIAEQSVSLNTMTDIMDMTRKGLALAKMMRRVHSTGSSVDVSTLKESLLQRSGFATGTDGMGSERKTDVTSKPSKPSIGGGGRQEEVHAGGESSFMTIAPTSDVFELATVHSSPLFESSATKGPSEQVSESLPEAAHGEEAAGGSTVVGERNLETELSFSGDMLAQDGEPQNEVGEEQGASMAETRLLPGEDASDDEAELRGGLDQSPLADASPSALETISAWTAHSPVLLTSAKKRESKKASEDESARSPLAAIQNLGSPLRSAHRLSERKHVPSPDIENQTPGPRNFSSTAPVFSSQRLPSPQYAAKVSLGNDLQETSPISTKRQSGPSLVTSRFGRKDSPLLRSSRLGLAAREEASKSPLASTSKLQTAFPPRRFATNTPVKRSLDYPALETPASTALGPRTPAVSPYVGWPMPALVAASEPPEKISLATASELEQLGLSRKLAPELAAKSSRKDAKEETPQAGHFRTESLGGSPFFADLTTPVRSRSPPARSATSSAATGSSLHTGFDWGLQKLDSPLLKLPDLALPSQRLLEDPGPPARKRGANLDIFGQCFKELSNTRGPDFTTADVREEDLERIEGFDGTSAAHGGEANKEAQASTSSEGATQQGSGEELTSPKKGVEQDALFEQGLLQSDERRKARKQGRLSRELGGTRGTMRLEARERKAQSRSVTLKDITAPLRKSAHKAPEVVQSTSDSSPSVSPASTPQANRRPPSTDVRARTGLCSVVIVLEEGKLKGKAPNPVIGCIDAPKTTTLAALRARIQAELGPKRPERFAFLQAGVGATWHPFSGDAESLVTVLTLPVADGEYRQYAASHIAETSTPVESPSPSPTRHAVRLAILRPLPIKRALYPLASAEDSAGKRKSVVDTRKESTRGSLPAGARKSGFATRPRSAQHEGAAEAPGPWAAKPAASLARVSAGGLSVRMSGSLRESAVAAVARVMRARDN